ncbi:MAG: hypothetical protein WCG50_01225 [Rhodoferax sp.]|uniref:hypothetical protein n=1 Tax=Rhodoferax sp. TaxID=50421 RepID=UPI00301A2E39
MFLRLRRGNHDGQPIEFSGGPRYYATSTDGGAYDWTFRATLPLLLPMQAEKSSAFHKPATTSMSMLNAPLIVLVLSLLSLFIGFSFSMAVSRYDQRNWHRVRSRRSVEPG